MSLVQIEAHQRRHGFINQGIVPAQTGDDQSKLDSGQIRKPKNRMNRSETEFSLILEARKRRGEILEWRFEAMSLAWGLDPVTGKPMWYTADFLVRTEAVFPSNGCFDMVLIEVKGPHIREKDLIRFKGARSDWPQFRFELWQRDAAGQWSKIL